MKKTTPSPAAALANMRWAKATDKQREQVGKDLANARWSSKSEAERKAIGKKLAAARAAKRKKKAK